MKVADGKRAYVLMCHASRNRPGGTATDVYHSVLFSSAVSDDEATGIGYRAARALYPPDSRWYDHFVIVRRIDDIVRIGDLLFDSLVPIL